MVAKSNNSGEKQPRSNKDAGVLRNRYKILLQNPVPIMDSGYNRAYKVEDLRDPSSQVFALISEAGVPFRDELAEKLTAKSAPGMVELHSHGVVQFDEGDFRYAFVFDFPSEGRVFTNQTGPLTEQEVLGKVVPRVIDTIIDMAGRGLSHRAIRADNLFYMDEGKLGMVLGECVSMPGGSLQPAIYEPLESANAHPFGRGDGNVMSDIYALGVLVCHLLGGVVPGEGRSQGDLYAAKLQQGSYAVLVPKIPASARTGFLLAGLLNDDPSRRWNIEVLKRWREGVYERPRPGFGDRRAPGPLVFEDVEYVSPRLLALALAKRPSQAFALLENGKLESWVRNSLNDKDAGMSINEIVSRANGTKRGLRRNEVQAISRVSAILDHQGAIWYRDVTFGRRGLNTLLAFAVKEGGAMKNNMAELIESNLLIDIIYSDLNKRKNDKRKEESWLKLGLATDCVEYLEKRDHLGYGLERCLYELNPSVSCQSTALGGAYVSDITDFLQILEYKALKAEGKINPFDRHSSAFVAARTKSLAKNFQKLATLNKESVDYTLTLLGIFSRMQNLSNPGPMPGLCMWVGKAITPLINKIHSELRREFVKSKYEKVKETGNIEKILQAIDIKNNLNRDEREYEQAIRAFAVVEHNIGVLGNGAEGRKFEAQKYGQWIASLLSISTLLSSMGLSYLYFY
ncbi:MAG: hypothetical protein V7750_00180 [Sneathiella sp.]